MLTQKSTSIIVILVAIVLVSTGKCSEAGNWFTKSLDYYSLEKCSPLDKSNMAGDFNACMNSPVDPSSTPATASASGKTGGWGSSGGASSGGFSAKSAKGFNFQGGSKPGSSLSTKQSTGDSWPISLISELKQIVNCFPKLLKPCMTKSEQDFYLTIRDFFQAQIDYGSANASSIAKKISSSGCLKSNSIDTNTICFSTNVHNQNWFGWKINWIDGQMCHFINDISTCEVKSFDKCPLEVKQFAVGLWKAGLKVTPCLKQTDETTATTKASLSSSSLDNSNQNVPVSKATSSQVSGPVKLKASRANIYRADKALNDQPFEQSIKNQDQFETDSDASYKRSDQRDSFDWRKNLFGNTDADDNFQANLEHSKLVKLHEVDGEGESRHDRGNRHKGVSEEQWTRIKEEYRRKMRESEESRESDEDEYENESEESDEDKRTDIIGHQSKRIFFNPHFWRHQRRNNYDQEDDFGEYYGNRFLRIRRSAADDAKEKEEMEREKKADETERLREEAEEQREIDDQLKEEEEEEQRRKDEDAEEAAQDEEERQREIEEEKQEAEEAKNEKKKGKRFTRSLKLTKKIKEEEEAEEAREKEQEKKEKEQEEAEEAREREQEEAEEAREKEQEEAEAAREKEQEKKEKEQEEAEEAREREQEEAEEAREKEEQAREDEEEAAEAAREQEEEEEEKRQELEEKKREAKKEKSKRNKRDIRGRKQWEDYEERDREEQERQRERFLERAGRLQEATSRRLETIERQRQEGEERLKRIREEADRRHEETKKRLEKADELGYLDINRLEGLREESNKRRLEALKRSNTFKHRHEEDEEEERRKQIKEEADRRREENERQIENERRKEENERRREEAERRQSWRREDNNDDNLIVRPQRYGRNNFVNNQFNNNHRNNDDNGDNSEIAGSALKDCIKSASNSWSYVSQNHKHDDIMEIMCRNIDSVHSCLDKHASTNDPSISHRLNHLKVTHQALCDSNNKPKDLNQVKKIQQCIIDQRSSNQQTSNRQTKYPDIFNRRPNWQ